MISMADGHRNGAEGIWLTRCLAVRANHPTTIGAVAGECLCRGMPPEPTHCPNHIGLCIRRPIAILKAKRIVRAEGGVLHKYSIHMRIPSAHVPRSTDCDWRLPSVKLACTCTEGTCVVPHGQERRRPFSQHLPPASFRQVESPPCRSVGHGKPLALGEEGGGEENSRLRAQSR